MQEPIFIICSHCATVPKYLIVKITAHSLSASSFISFILDGIISSSFPCHASYDKPVPKFTMPSCIIVFRVATQSVFVDISTIP